LEKQVSSRNERPFSASDAACVLAAAPVAVAPAKYGANTLWFFESCVGIGAIKMGVPGLVAQFFFVSPIPVFRRIISERSVGGLPLLPYSTMFVSGLLWCTYGLLIDNSAVWLSNSAPVFFGATYTAIFMKYCPADAQWLPGTKSMHLLGMALAVAFVGGTVFTQERESAASIIASVAICMVVIMFAGPLTVMRSVIQEKSTKNLPFPMMVATVANCALWTFYGAEIIHDPYITIPNGLGLISGLAQAALFMRYGICR
jgi:solute carrier family 50 protein (sugar transporter)